MQGYEHLSILGAAMLEVVILADLMYEVRKAEEAVDSTVG
jgi:hypothetical protein